MPFDNILGDLLDAAFQSLSEKSKPDYSNCSSIKLTVDNATSDVFTFSLYNCIDRFHWERKIWYKQSDISKVSNPIESLKYIGQKVIPNIIEQGGETELEEAKEIFSLANLLSSLANDKKSDMIVIDGTEYSLEIKVGGMVKEFKWKVIPRGWENVELLSNKIIELNNRTH